MTHSTAQSIVVGSIVANLVVSNTVVRLLGLKSHSLSRYYEQLNMIAVCLDITSVTWGVLLAQHILSHRHTEIYKVLAVSIAVQVLHDVCFAMWIRRSTSQRQTIRLFQSYAREHGTWILLIDALIMTVAVLVSRVLSNTNMSARGVTLTMSFALYVHLLFLDGL